MPDGGTINAYPLDLEQLEPFLRRVIDVAECWYEGNFVACGYGEVPGTDERLTSQIHVVPNDLDALGRLIDAFHTINRTPGLNAYLSIGLFKPRDQWRNLRGRGGEDDLIGTLAFVGDFDRGHDPATCLDRLPLSPHFVVETSAGNYQTWQLLERPYPVGEAKPLFAALTRALGSDHTFSCEHRVAAQWWRGLQPHFPDGRPNPNGDRAALARLRRADLVGAMQDPATFALFRALGRTRPSDLQNAALCAAVLATVREDDPRTHAARQLGAPPGEPQGTEVLKPLRFRRLIEADTEQEQLLCFRRAAALAGGKLNVRELAAACLDWSETRRRIWIFNYYNAGFGAPAAEPTHEDAPA